MSHELRTEIGRLITELVDDEWGMVTMDQTEVVDALLAIPEIARALAILDAYDRLWAADTRRHDAVMALEDSTEHALAMYNAERAIRLLRPPTGEPT
jgi:hypothetical protein